MRLPNRQLVVVVIVSILACMAFGCGVFAASPTPTPTAAPPTATLVAPTAVPAPTTTPLTPSAAVAPQGLGDVVWKLQRFEYMSGKVTAIDQPDKYTVQFLADGKVQVKADCNTGNGVYKASGDRLTIENIGLTKMACPSGSQGDKFVQSLGMAVSYVLDGAQLTISMSYDAGDMVFGK